MDAATRFVRPVTEPARLTSAQKRDLLGIAASALVTSALIAAPMIIADAPAPTLMAARVDIPFASPLEPEPAAVTPLAAAAIERAPLPSPQRRRASSLSRRSTGIQIVTDLRPSAPAAQTAQDRSQRKPLARRLTGLFTGDGTYSVRPFPTIATER